MPPLTGPLRDLDEVAYLRFASIYREFESLTDFEDEISPYRDGGSMRPRPHDWYTLVITIVRCITDVVIEFMKAGGCR